jgi:hypothetical protein
MQRRFCRIATRCECHERVTEVVYRTMPTSADHDFGARSSYATRMSSVSAGHDDYPDLGLGTIADVLSQLEYAPDTMQPL